MDEIGKMNEAIVEVICGGGTQTIANLISQCIKDSTKGSLISSCHKFSNVKFLHIKPLKESPHHNKVFAKFHGIYYK